MNSREFDAVFFASGEYVPDVTNKAMSPERRIPNNARMSEAPITASGLCFTCTLMRGV